MRAKQHPSSFESIQYDNKKLKLDKLYRYIIDWASVNLHVKLAISVKHAIGSIHSNHLNFN